MAEADDAMAGRGRLARFLSETRETILAAWEQRVRSAPHATELTEPALRDDIPALIDRIVDVLDDPDAPPTLPPAEGHAVERLIQGFDLDVVVQEYATLRDCIHAQWNDACGGGASVADLDVVDRAIDTAITIAVKRYLAARDRAARGLDLVSMAALESDSVDAFLERLLHVLVDTTASVDTAVVLLREGDALRVHASVGLDEATGGALVLPADEGFAGAILSSGIARAVTEPELDLDALSPRMRRRGVRALLGLPLRVSGEVIGVAQLGSTSAPSFSSQDARLFAEMAARAATGISQHLLRDQAEARAVELDRRRRQSKFLDEVGHELASTLDVDEALHRLVEATVPRKADWCAVELIEAGQVRLAAIAHSDPDARADLVEAMTKDPIDADQRRAVWSRVWEQGEELITHIDEEAVLRHTASPERAALARALGLDSAMILPLTARGRILGAMTLATSRPECRYNPDDVPFGRQLASRTAIAVDNARLYREATDAARVREQVMGIVSHDLRNPLATIAMSAAVLERKPDLREVVLRQVDLIRRATQQARRLIDDLLDVTSLRAGKLSIVRQQEAIAPIVEEVINAQRPLALELGIGLRADVRLDHAQANVDRARVLQILSNLIGNALKFCRPGDLVTVVACEAGGEIVFDVADTGPGIAPAQLAHVFETFWSGGVGRRSTGLGLAIVRGLVEAHHGRVWAESEVGVGTTMHVALPTG